MKSEKGVTLVSLIIYIIGLTAAIVMITVVSSFFYKNIDTSGDTINSMVEYTKFNSYFTEQINKKNIEVVNCDSNCIVFSDGSQYTFIQENKGIYFGNIKIIRNVENCNFEYIEAVADDQKDTIKVRISFIDSETTKENSYTIN